MENVELGNGVHGTLSKRDNEGFSLEGFIFDNSFVIIAAIKGSFLSLVI